MSTSDQEKETALDIPDGGWSDRVRTAILGGLGAIPIAGQAASALVDMFWQPTFERRVRKYLEYLVRNLQTLDVRVADLEALVGRDVAVSIGIAGARAAGNTHDNTKLHYLANAASRVTADKNWDANADMAIVLMQIMDTLTVTHIQILELTADPTRWENKFPSEQYGEEESSKILAEAFPTADNFILKTIASDLVSKGLVSPDYMFFGGTFLSKRGATEFGLRLLALIKDIPLQENFRRAGGSISSNRAATKTHAETVVERLSASSQRDTSSHDEASTESD